MSKTCQPHQPATVKLDLQGIIPFGDCSNLFTVDNVSVTAYKQGTSEKIPVKFTVLDSNKNRVLTNDPFTLSSKWQVEGINRGHSIKIAGTDTEPFSRTLSMHKDENRLALLNVLRFMMSNSLWTSERAIGALDVLVATAREAFAFTCDMCSETGVARVTKGPSGHPVFSFPQCADSYVCIPSGESCVDEDNDALRNILALLRSASLDNLAILNHITREMATHRPFQELDCASFPPRQCRGDIVIPFELLKYTTSLYQTMSEFADNIAIVDEKTPYVKLLIESPSEIGEITGRMSLTLIYGSTLSAIYGTLRQGSRDNTEGCDQIECLANLTQVGNDVLLRRAHLGFVMHNPMPLRDWRNYYG